MKKGLSRGFIAVILGIFVMGFSVFAFQVSASSTTSNTVTICVKNSGFVYVVGQGFWTKDCGKRDKLITINSEGVPGPKGDKGDKGDSCDLFQINQNISDIEQKIQELNSRLSCLSKVGNNLYFDNCNITVRNGTIQAIPPEVVLPPTQEDQATIIIIKNSLYDNLNISPNTTSMRVGSFVFTASSTEPIRLTDVNIGFLSGHEHLSNLKLIFNNVNSITKATVNETNNHFPTELIIQPNASVIVDVYADISNDASGTIQAEASSINGIGSISYNSIMIDSMSNLIGQLMTIVN